MMSIFSIVLAALETFRHILDFRSSVSCLEFGEQTCGWAISLNSYDAVTNKKQAQEHAENPDMRENEQEIRPNQELIDDEVLVGEMTYTWEHCAVVKICKSSKRKSLKIIRYMDWTTVAQV